MSAKRIVIESHNLTLKGGTGIATYARTLAGVAQASGFKTAGLFGVEAPLSKGNALLNEIRVFDARKEKRPSLTSLARKAAEAVIGDPFGVHPTRLTRSGLVIDPGSSLFADSFDETYALSGMALRSRRHFQRYGRSLPVHFDAPPDIFHTTHPVPLIARNAANICTIHDIVPLRLPYTTMDNKKYFYRLLKSIIETCDHIATVSEYSRQDLIRFFGVDERRITNTYQTVIIPSADLARPTNEVADELRTTCKLDYGEYFLFVGAVEPKKNISRLIEAFVASGSRKPLVLVGGLGWQYEDDLKCINDERFLSYAMENSRITPERRVRHLDYVPQRRLISLMRGARALLFPSIYEGFGLPVLEAMQLGTPVMTSNRSSLPEVAGEAALLVDPYDIDAMARAIRRLDADEDLCGDLRARGPRQAENFSAEKYAARLQAMYKNLS